jgi:hypothetical protein
MAILFGVVALSAGWLLSGAPALADELSDAHSLNAVQHAFYNGHYERAAELALDLRKANPENLAAYELRTSALHFQLKDALGSPRDKRSALKECERCGGLMAAFLD